MLINKHYNILNEWRISGGRIVDALREGPVALDIII